MYKKIFLVLFSFIILVQCSSSDDDASALEELNTSYDRSKMLVHWADNIIIPAHSFFQANLFNLDNSTKSFVANPNQSNLDDLRSKWLLSYKSWQHIFSSWGIFKGFIWIHMEPTWAANLGPYC